MESIIAFVRCVIIIIIIENQPLQLISIFVQVLGNQRKSIRLLLGILQQN